jgi:glycosyltransferase involved in cell wall biosynthesis
MPQRAGGRDAVKERLCVETASRSGAFIFVSQAAQAAYGARYRIRPSWKVVHNGIDLQIWRPGLARLPYRLGVPVGAPVVSIVAALRAPKGHSLAVDAWPAVLAQVPEARLVIVGDGDEEPNLRNQVRRAGLQDRVIFAGRVSDERETADIVRASDVVLLPSYTEALPTTLIEAAACARAVVATDVGGVREVVRDGISGIVIPPADPARIAAAVVELLLDPDRRAQLGAAGEVLARERFDMRVWARALRAVYEGAICRGPAVARSARQELRSST